MSGPGWETASAPVPPMGPRAAAPLPGEPARAGRLRLLSRILIAYGVIALVGAIIAALLLVLAFGRVTALTDQLTSNAGGASAVLEKTATALEDAGTTAASFATTLDSGSSALLGATNDMRQIVPRLRDLESAANAVTIIGAQPLGRLATLFGEIATNLTDVDDQLDQVSKSLVGNRSALEANARSLQALGGQVRTLAGQLGRSARRGDRQHPLADPRPPDRRDDRSGRAGGRRARDRLVAPWLARPDDRGRRLGGPAAPRLAEVAPERRSRRVVTGHPVDAAARRGRRGAQVDPRAPGRVRVERGASGGRGAGGGPGSRR